MIWNGLALGFSRWRASDFRQISLFVEDHLGNLFRQETLIVASECNIVFLRLLELHDWTVLAIYFGKALIILDYWEWEMRGSQVIVLAISS